jgi:hypothetical protein
MASKPVPTNRPSRKLKEEPICSRISIIVETKYRVSVFFQDQAAANLAILTIRFIDSYIQISDLGAATGGHY